MDARINRDAYLKTMKAQASRLPQQTWYEWFWRIKPILPASSVDCATSEVLRTAFRQLLDQTEPPETFKPSEVALCLSNKDLKSLGYSRIEEAIPGVYELAFELREFGDCEILRKGKVLGDNVTLQDIDGPIRIRRLAM